MDTNKKDLKGLLIMALMAGRIMLRNGAETYRVEDTILRLCRSRMNIKYAEAFVTPTGIFITLEYKDEVLSYTYRIKSRYIDLNKVALVNEFSRKFVMSEMTTEEGTSILKEIEKKKPYSLPVQLLFGGLGGSFFSLLSGGALLDLISTFITSLTLVGIFHYLYKVNLSFFLRNFIGGMVATILSIFFVEIGIGQDLNKIIIGTIIILVPGVSITNAIRDSITEDFLSGISRGMEALIIALSIAFGVGITLSIYFETLGGI